MTKRVLPVKYPPITYEPTYAYKLSIILNHSQGWEWFYDHFIGYFGYQFADYNMAMKYESLWETDRCPLISEHCLKYHSPLTENRKSFVDFVISAIKSNYYLEIFVDDFYLKEFEAYNKEHNLHPLFIYGYDGEEEQFYFGEFYRNDKFDFGKLSFHEVEQAMQNVMNIEKPKWATKLHLPADTCNLYELKNVNYRFNLSFFKNSLEEFFLSTPVKKGEVDGYDAPNDIIPGETLTYYGLTSYDLIRKCLDFHLPNGNTFFPANKVFSFLVEHKASMAGRAKFLMEQGILKQSSEIAEKYGQLEKKARILLSTHIKYELTKRQKQADKVRKLVDQLAEEEKNIVRIFLNEI